MKLQCINPLDGIFELSHGNDKRKLREAALIPLGGDIAGLVARAKAQPLIEFDVPNTTNAKGLKPRNYGAYARHC